MAGWTNGAAGSNWPRNGGRQENLGDDEASLRGPPADAADTRPADLPLCTPPEPAPKPARTGPRLVSVNSNPDLQLARVIELEIIPRLMLMHSHHVAQPAAPAARVPITDQHVDALVQLSISADASSASSYVRGMMDAGADLEDIFLDLLAPTARRLGELWESDAVDFTQVTIGLWRLQELLYEQSSRLVTHLSPGMEGQRALLAAVPGAQHTFGVTMVAELFSRAGWDVRCENRCDWPDLEQALGREWFDMFGLSVATTDSIPQVASAILKLRQLSVNPNVLVMVGGPMAAIHPDLASLCGADAMATEAAIGVEVATRWVAASRLQA